MSQNRKAEVVAAISSSEEDEDASSEDTESEGEEIKTSPATPPVAKKPSASKKPATNQTPSVPQSSSSDGSQAESETESESTPEKPPKPVKDSSKSTKKPGSEPSAPASKAGAGAKRPAEVDAKDSKRVKTTAAEDDQKKMFQRLWSEDDEIAILKGIMEYTSENGVDPMSDMQAFYDFIKKSVHVDVTKSQLAAKVRRLKKKYENNASKEKGKDRTFSKAHEKKAYELSKKVWGKKANTNGGEIEVSTKVNNPSEKKNQNQNQRASSAKANGSEKKNQKPKVVKVSPVDDQEEDPMVEIDPNLTLSKSNELSGSVSDTKFQDEMMKNGIELIKGDQKKELDEKWKKQRLLEAEVYLKRLDLAREQMALVIEAIKSQPQAN